MKRTIRRRLEREKAEIITRLAPLIGGKEPKAPGEPEFNGPRAQYEIAGRVRAVPYGGLGAMHDLVREVGLPDPSRHPSSAIPKNQLAVPTRIRLPAPKPSR